MDKEAYAAYLQTPRWRGTRNQALRRALWKCERCSARRNLQVHHKSYDRLGHELDSDLEVLCEGCHRGHHKAEMHDNSHSRVYLKMASEALARNPWASVSDIAEDVKTKCAQAKLGYDNHEADRAINILTGSNRFRSGLPKTQHELLKREGRPFSHQESVELLARLGVL